MIACAVSLNSPTTFRDDFAADQRGFPDGQKMRMNVAFDLTFDLHVAGYILKETAGQDFQGLVDLLDLYARTVELPA